MRPGIPSTSHSVIAKDRGEQSNLASQKPEVVGELATQLADYLRAADATMPVVKKTGEKVAWPGSD